MNGIHGTDEAALTNRRHATFTELYELILDNETLVRTELELLRKLLDAKISETRPPVPLRAVNRFPMDVKRPATFGWG